MVKCEVRKTSLTFYKSGRCIQCFWIAVGRDATSRFVKTRGHGTATVGATATQSKVSASLVAFTRDEVTSHVAELDLNESFLADCIAATTDPELNDPARYVLRRSD